MEIKKNLPFRPTFNELLGKYQSYIKTQQDYINQLLTVAELSPFVKEKIEDFQKNLSQQFYFWDEISYSLIDRVDHSPEKIIEEFISIDLEKLTVNFIEKLKIQFSDLVEFKFNILEQPPLILGDAKGIENLLWGILFHSTFPFIEKTTLTLELDTVDSFARLRIKILPHSLNIESGQQIDFHPHKIKSNQIKYIHEIVTKPLGKKGEIVEIYFSMPEQNLKTAMNLTMKVEMPVTQPDSISHLPKDTNFKQTILLAEDQDSLRHLLREMLEDQGYLVLTAKNVYEILTIFNQKKNNIDLLITDILMPEMSGPDLMRQIYRQGRKTKPLYISGLSASEAVEHFNKNDVPEIRVSVEENFLHKPFKVDDLIESVKKILES
jgi:CheY-like chemotaxis protein